MEGENGTLVPNFPFFLCCVVLPSPSGDHSHDFYNHRATILDVSYKYFLNLLITYTRARDTSHTDGWKAVTEEGTLKKWYLKCCCCCLHNQTACVESRLVLLAALRSCSVNCGFTHNEFLESKKGKRNTAMQNSYFRNFGFRILIHVYACSNWDQG